MRNFPTLEKPCSIMAGCRRGTVITEKEFSPERSKFKEDYNLFPTRSWKMVKESSLSILWWQDHVTMTTVFSNPGFDLCQVQGNNEIATRFIQNTGQNFPRFCCSNMFKCGLPDFTCTCSGNLKN